MAVFTHLRLGDRTLIEGGNVPVSPPVVSTEILVPPSFAWPWTINTPVITSHAEISPAAAVNIWVVPPPTVSTIPIGNATVLLGPLVWPWTMPVPVVQATTPVVGANVMPPALQWIWQMPAPSISAGPVPPVTTVLPAWVSPGSGSDSNPGTVTQPYATWGKAISEGHTFIYVAPGTHNVSSVNAAVTFMAFPTTHTLSNAPVTSDTPFNLLASIGRQPSRYINAYGVFFTGSGQDLFQISDGATDLYGGRFSGIRFNKSSISRSAIYTSNVSGMMVDLINMTFPSSNYEDKHAVWATGTSGHKVRDWVLDKNFVNRQSYVRISGAATFHNWFVGVDIGGGETRQLEDGNPVRIIYNEWFRAESTCRGFLVSGGSYEFGAGSQTQFNPAEGGWRFNEPLYQSAFIATMGEAFHHNTGNCRLNLVDARSCFVLFQHGDWSGPGKLKVNGDYYHDSMVDTANASPLKYTRLLSCKVY